jgi:predicted  nucleic acid-binding Zn-ribbon protein
MSDALQAEIDRLKSENQKLTRDLAGAQDDLKEVRAEARDRRHENKALATQVAELTTDRDKYRTLSEQDPEGLRTQVSDLTGKLRERNHLDAFQKVARNLKVTDEKRIADLYALSGYKPEADQIDEAVITSTIQATVKERSYLLDPTPPPAAAGAAQPAAGAANGAATSPAGGKPGPGSDRGVSNGSDTKAQAPQRIPGRF